MQIKRFEAKSMTTALRLVKSELGADAVILSARSIRKGKGFLGSVKYAGVEVTAAVDTEPSLSRSRTARERHGSLSNYKTSDVVVAKSDLNQNGLVSQRNVLDGLTRQARHGARKKVDSHGRNKALAELYQQLLLQDVDRGLASELVENIKQIPASEELITIDRMMVHIISILEDIGVAVETAPMNAQNRNVKVFVGTSGVGKTTTIAKLAARFAMQHGQRHVALVSTDTYRIGAHEQLITYGRLLGVAVHSANTGDDLRQLLHKLQDKKLILIDTAGMSQRDLNISQQFAHMSHPASMIKPYLVLSANAQLATLDEVISAFKGANPVGCILTKLDEAASLGGILSAMVQHHLPAAYISNGQKVPEDLRPARARELVEMAIKQGLEHKIPLDDEFMASVFSSAAAPMRM